MSRKKFALRASRANGSCRRRVEALIAMGYDPTAEFSPTQFLRYRARRGARRGRAGA